MVPSAESGTVAPQAGPDAHVMSEALDSFGDMIPGGDPNWAQTVCSVSCLRVSRSNDTVPLAILQSKPRRSPSRGPRVGRRGNHAQRD